MNARHLILMRHATAGAAAGRDFDRPLARRGVDEAHRVGERLRKNALVPSRVLCSSARRCRETWEALAIGLGAGRPDAEAVEFDDRLYNASTNGLLDAIESVGSAETLLVIAHNPGISLLALELGLRSGGEPTPLRDGFSPASTAVFDVEGDWQDLTSATFTLRAFERAEIGDRGQP